MVNHNPEKSLASTATGAPAKPCFALSESSVPSAAILPRMALTKASRSSVQRYLALYLRIQIHLLWLTSYG